MIKPDTLWNLFKNCRSPLTLGRVCFGLAGREDKLDQPLNEYEFTLIDMIKESEEWHEEAVEGIKSKNRFYYLKRKVDQKEASEAEIIEYKHLYEERYKQVSTNSTVEKVESELNQLNGIPSFLPSVLPSVPPKESSASHSPACAGASEKDASQSSDSAPFDFDWLVADFEKLDVSRRFMAGRVITREELKAWYDWQNEIGQWKLGGGLAITKTNYRKYVSYGIPKIRRMLRERAATGNGSAAGNGESLHQITREEFAAYCAKQNEGFSVQQITGEEEEAVWASLVALNYHLLNGQIVTTGNIGYFTRPELKRIREEAEARRQQDEQEDVYQDKLFLTFRDNIGDAVQLLKLRERIGLDGIKKMANYVCVTRVEEWAKQGLVPKVEDLHKYSAKDLALKARDKVRRIRAAEREAAARGAAAKGAKA